MGATTNTVQMMIQVVDGGSAAAVQKVTTSLNELDAQAAKVGAAWGIAGTQAEAAAEQMGAAGTQARAAGTAGAAAGDKIAHGMSEAHTQTRLLRGEMAAMGMMPGLAPVLAQSHALLAVMGALGTAFMGVAAIEIGVMAAKGVHTLYEKWIDANYQLDQYNQKASAAAEKKLFDTASLETTSALLAAINQQLTDIDNQRGVAYQRMDRVAVTRAGGVMLTTDLGEKERNDAEARLRAQGDPLRERRTTLEQAQAQGELKRQSDYDAAMAPDEKTKSQAHFRGAIAQAEQKYFFERYNEQELAKRAAPELMRQGVIQKPEQALDFVRNAFQSERDEAHRQAEAQMKGETAGISRNEAKEKADQAKQDANERKQWVEEEIRMRNDATNAALHGEALYAAQLSQHEDEIRRKIAETAGFRATGLAEIAALEDKYHTEKMKRLQDEEVEIGKSRLQAEGAGLTGAAKIQHEGEAKQYEIGMQLLKGEITPEKYWALQAAAEKETGAEMLKDQESFFQRVDQLSESSAEHQVAGFARIAAEARKQRDNLHKEFEGDTRGLDQTSPEFAARAAAYQRGVGAINGAAGTQSDQLYKRNADETLKLEEEANRKLLMGEAAKTAQIEDEYTQRVRKYDEMLKQTEISQEDHDRRILAAARERDAELKQQAEETRDKLAGELSGLFKNPSQWMKGLGEKAMSQAAASFMMRIPGMERAAGGKGGLMGSLEDGTWMSAFFSHSQAQDATGTHQSMFSRLRHPGAHGAQLPGQTAAQMAGAMASTLSVASATIHVGSASINLGGVGAAGTSGPKGALSGGVGGGVENAASTALSTSTPGYTSADSTATLSGEMPGGASMPTAGAGGAGSVGGDSLAKMTSAFGYGQDMLHLADQLGIKLPKSMRPQEPNASSQEDVTAEMNPGAGSGGGAGANLAGAASGGMGLVGAAMGDGGFGGAMGGAMSGAQLGSIAGPIGTAVGAGAGFVLGLLGFGGRAKAAAYFHKQVEPHLDQTQQQFDTGQMDYLTAYADLQSLQIEADKATRNMGWGGRSYYNDTIKPTIMREENKITGEAKAGRAQFTMSAAQFHGGGTIGDFGDLATSSNEGFIHAMRGEIVMRQQAAQTNAPVLHAMNSGMDFRDLLPSKMQPMRQNEVNLHFYSPDAKGARQLLMDNKHHVREALDSSYSEYSGGADAGF